MRVGAARQLALRRHGGYWYRAIQLKHYQSLLAFAHTVAVPSRFNTADPRHSFPLLYFTENQQVALWESRALAGSPYPGGPTIAISPASWVVIAVRVRLQGVANLTSRRQLQLIRSTVQELTGDWQGYRLRRPTQPTSFPYTDAPTQQLGAELEQTTDVEGLVTYSAVDSRYKNLVVFPAKLLPGSWIKFINPITGHTDRIGP
jgi:hypothetical protein